MSSDSVKLRAACARIADAYLSALPPEQVGSVVLRSDQRVIVSRAQRLVDSHGGCLVAEDVGRGKTFIALALAAQWPAALILVPSALKSQWRAAAERASISNILHSHEALSAGRLPTGTYHGIIVDESHHFRNRATRRYSALARLAKQAPLILLSATPLQNAHADLASQIALFLGQLAYTIDPDHLAQFIVKGEGEQIAGMPSVEAPEWRSVDVDDRKTLDTVMALSSPPRPSGGGDAGALRTLSLVRAWSSSRAALRAALHTRQRSAIAIEQCLAEGRLPTRRELRAWSCVDECVQLGFPTLLSHVEHTSALLEQARATIDTEHSQLRALFRHLMDTADPDDARVRVLLDIRNEHPSRRILAFSSYASTVHAYFRRLRAHHAVGMLTSGGAFIATGRIPRDDALRRFAPRAQNHRPLARHDAITLLLTTDLLAEGVNLQDASVVVHLDLPWNPARMSQRVGRVRRPGGAETVRTFLVAPPADEAHVVGVERRLREKLHLSDASVGSAFEILPEPHVVESRRAMSASVALGSLAALLTAWRAHERPLDAADVAAVRANVAGFLVAFDDGRLIVFRTGGAHSDTLSLLSVVREVDAGVAEPVDDVARADAIESIHRFLAAEALDSTCGLTSRMVTSHRAVERWTSSRLRAAKRHERTHASGLAAQLLAALGCPLPIGIEDDLRVLMRDGPRSPVDQLTNAVSLVRAATSVSRATDSAAPRVVAMILLQSGPTTSSADRTSRSCHADRQARNASD